jgi:hypothetical protein
MRILDASNLMLDMSKFEFIPKDFTTLRRHLMLPMEWYW